MKRFIDYFSHKSVKQRVYLIIGFVLLLTLCFFIIKGNIVDKPTKQTNTSSSVSQEAESGTEEIPSDFKFHISIIDIAPLCVVTAGYGIHRYRRAKRERRK